MAIFPKVQNPCPYKSQLSEIMNGDFCRQCKRQVVDLSPLSDAQRMALLAGCADEICVSYKFPLLAAAAAAVALVTPMAAAAQDADEVSDMIMVGGITDPANVEYISDSDDSAVPELPVIYDTPRGEAANQEAPQASPPESWDSASSPDLGHRVETQ